jgi:hypothetical protein
LGTALFVTLDGHVGGNPDHRLAIFLDLAMCLN